MCHVFIIAGKRPRPKPPPFLFFLSSSPHRYALNEGGSSVRYRTHLAFTTIVVAPVLVFASKHTSLCTLPPDGALYASLLGAGLVDLDRHLWTCHRTNSPLHTFELPLICATGAAGGTLLSFGGPFLLLFWFFVGWTLHVAADALQGGVGSLSRRKKRIGLRRFNWERYNSWGGAVFDIALELGAFCTILAATFLLPEERSTLSELFMRPGLEELAGFLQLLPHGIGLLLVYSMSLIPGNSERLLLSHGTVLGLGYACVLGGK